MALDANHDFVVRNAVIDDEGGIHVRYDQTYRGVKVWTGEAIVHQGTNQRDTELTSELKSSIDLGTKPSLSAADVTNIADRDLRPLGPYTYAPTAELIVYPHTASRSVRMPSGAPTACSMPWIWNG
jgi:Zn-dependent metalloprotease